MATPTSLTGTSAESAIAIARFTACRMYRGPRRSCGGTTGRYPTGAGAPSGAVSPGEGYRTEPPLWRRPCFARSAEFATRILKRAVRAPIVIQRARRNTAQLPACPGNGPSPVGHQALRVAESFGCHIAGPSFRVATGARSLRPFLHALTDDVSLYFGKGQESAPQSISPQHKEQVTVDQPIYAVRFRSRTGSAKHTPATAHSQRFARRPAS